MFIKIGKDKVRIPRAKDNSFSRILKDGDRNYGTITLNHYIKKCTKIKYDDEGQVAVNLRGRIKNFTIDKKVFKSMCATTIIAHDFPYN